MGFGIKTSIGHVLAFARGKEILPIETVSDPNRMLNGKVALIAGGSGGIGMAIASSLIDSSAHVILGGTSEAKLLNCSEKLGGGVSSVLFDLSKPSSIDASVTKTVDRFGNIDIFVCCAGVHTENAGFWTMTPEEYDRVMSINLRGAFFACQSVSRHMVDTGRRGGHILLVNSSRGFEPAWSPYGISKWGLRGLTEGLAQILLPYGIVVNGIAPGSTATGLIGVGEGDSIASTENGLGRMALPSEIAQWARMLVSPAGDMIVGETVLVSGGRGCIDIR